MRVILLKDIRGLGKEGDTVTVADGHAQNYLFPKHLAVPATRAAQEEIVTAAAQEAAAAVRELRALERLAAALDGFEVILRAAVNAQGTLYAAVTPVAIAGALAADGRNVDAAWVALRTPIKELGAHDVRIEMPHGLEVDICVIVEAAS